MRKSSVIILNIVIGILFVLRLLLVFPALQHPERFNAIVDSKGYIDLADGLLESSRFHSAMDPTLDILRTPGYPAFLALIKIIFRDYKWTSLIQLLITIFNAGIIFGIGLFLDKTKRVSYLATILYLLSINAAYNALLIMTETLASFLLLFSLWMLVIYWEKRGLGWLLVSGLVLGLAALVRPSVFPVILISVVIFTCLEIFRALKGQSLKKALTAVLVFGVSSYLFIFMWQLRNLSAFGSFTFSPVGTSSMKYWVIGEAIAEIEGISRQEAEYLINTSPDSVDFMIDFIGSNIKPFMKIQARGIIRTMIAVEYPYWANAIAGVEISGSGIISNMSWDPKAIFKMISSGNHWIFLGFFALAIDVLLFVLVLVSVARIILNRHDSSYLIVIFIFLVLEITYMIIIPFGHGSARFRAPVEPQLALLAGMAALKFKNSYKRIRGCRKQESFD